MAGAILGTIIISMATSVLVIAIETSEKAFNSAGKYSLTTYEEDMLKKAGLYTVENIKLLNSDILLLPVR